MILKSKNIVREYNKIHGVIVPVPTNDLEPSRLQLRDSISIYRATVRHSKLKQRNFTVVRSYSFCLRFSYKIYIQIIVIQTRKSTWKLKYCKKSNIYAGICKVKCREILFELLKTFLQLIQ